MRTVCYSKGMRYITTRQLGCFSPPVMIATFLIEIGLAGYVLWRYTLTAVTRLAVAILFFLSIFQLAEYNICEAAFGLSGLTWAKLGYVAITMLPPLGLHLAMRIAGDTRRGVLVFAYATAAAFIGFFALSGSGITSQACLGNYVIFQTAQTASWLYAAYYYGWLAAGVFYALQVAGNKDVPANASRALRALALGYASFIVPTAITNSLNPATLAGIPSIMCGFAVLLAIILAGEVLPSYFAKQSLTSWRRNA